MYEQESFKVKWKKCYDFRIGILLAKVAAWKGDDLKNFRMYVRISDEDKQKMLADSAATGPSDPDNDADTAELGEGEKSVVQGLMFQEDIEVKLHFILKDSCSYNSTRASRVLMCLKNVRQHPKH